ncbi:molybdopterin-dependent oxidoreductase [Maritimibacter dapengensis]|uniref:Molybdopterin-dependent oxidoreductase n=1 Tax=Maritimibacter dapengensis TaxID=2836868 RepID=A0ABS6T3Y2_9RHOB|nr:molybdopterin-dependent oxidoreductase [Maritimibacter dapengensis]MBV7379844.1 molybdopterin-dependent oxidoreductase [Maritimibacter dapengensis]
MSTTQGTLSGKLALVAWIIFHPLAAGANDLQMPTGDVVLSVTGNIAATNDGNAAIFDEDMLRALGETTFETTTIWTDGVQSFTGVSLKDLLDELGVDNGTLEARALNDYAVEIPVSDAVDGGPIVAYARNNNAMSIRDKGPLWIVYPYDSNDDYASETIYSRSIWQLDRIDVQD